MVALNRYAADRAYVVGERYDLAIRDERSQPSHRHYFACLSTAYDNLPEHLATRWATADHFRKFLLIRAGHYNELSVVCDSYQDAKRTALMAKKLDDYAIATTEGRVVTVFRAKSTSYRELSGDEFQRVKQKTLEIAAEMIGISVDELAKNAGTAA